MVIQVVCLSVLAVNHGFWPLYACILAKEAVFWIIGTSVFLKGLVVFPGRWAKMGMVLLGTSVALYCVNLTQAAIIAMGFMAALAFVALVEYRGAYRLFLSGGEITEADPRSAPVLRLN
jgi:hypothetical protein